MSVAAITREDAREELQRRVQGEIARRRNSPDFRVALVAAVVARGGKDTPPLPAQRRVLDDHSRLITLCCSRRAGKTEVLSRMIVRELEACGPNEWVVFGARTLGIAKDLIWDDIKAIALRFRLDWEFNNTELSIRTGRGGRFRLFGVDSKDAIEKGRGKKYRLVVCDEASTYDLMLKELVEVVFDPGTKDLQGRIVLSGTPGYVKHGYWYEASQGKVKGWSTHHWTIRDNVHIPNVEAELLRTREMFGWDEAHPTYVCEYLGVWADNSSLLVCDFSDSNIVDTLPDDYSPTWRHVIGIDYGYEDAIAWVVIAVNPYTDERYVIHHFEKSRMIGDEPVEMTRKLVQQFNTSYVVSDPAGGGKGFFETFNAKHGHDMKCLIRAANKVDKLGSVRLLNAELRTGRLKFLRSATPQLVGDLRRLLWKDELRQEIVEGRTFPDHGFDATRYALLETVAWRSKDKPAQTDPAAIQAQRDRDERAKRAQRKANAAWYER